MTPIEIKSKVTDVRMAITGMTCQGCASTIQDAVSRLEGARDVQANFALKQLIFEGVNREAVLKTVRELGYDSPDDDQTQLFHSIQIIGLGHEELKRARLEFIFAAILGVPEFVIGMGFLGNVHWVATEALISSVVVLGVGFDIHKRTFKQLLNRHVNMDTLVTLGSLAALLKSYVLFLRGSSMPGFEISSTIIMFILFGRYLEAKTRRASYSATAELFAIFQKKVVRVTKNGKEEEVQGLEIQEGDTILLRPGEVAPVDGVVVGGSALINQAAITGEPLPKSFSPGEVVLSGSSVIDSSIELQAENVGRESFLGRLITELERSQSQPVPMQRLADKVTSYFVPGVLLFASITALLQFNRGMTPEFAFNVFLSILLVACPCSLGLAIPTALVAGLGSSAKRGVLFRDAAILEATSDIRDIYFDKTGTLTQGEPVLTRVDGLGRKDRKELLTLAAVLERGSLHPLAKALFKATAQENIVIPPYTPLVKIKPGEGLEGDIKGHKVSLLRSKDKSDEGTTSDLFIDDKLEGRFVFEDALRPEAEKSLKVLKDWGLTLHLLTGDSLAAVNKLNISSYFETVRGQLLPQDKEFIIKAAVEKNKVGIAFVGDGINDVLALSAAPVGIAVASGTPAALGVGGISLAHGVVDLPLAFYFASMVSRQLKVNLFWAFGYNLIMLPWAATGSLSPMWASLAMAMSSVSVVLGSVWLGFRLQNLDLKKGSN